MLTNTKKLTTTAVMLALGTVLSLITVYRLPNGGGITAASMVPVVVVALLYKPGWSIFSAFVYALLQMLVGGVAAPPVRTFGPYVLVILLDYVIAFGVLGLAGIFFRMMGKKSWAAPVSAAIVVFMRFLCHFFSGIVIWDIYAPEGQSVALYSLLYNGSYMLAELIVTFIATLALVKVIQSKRENVDI